MRRTSDVVEVVGLVVVAVGTWMEWGTAAGMMVGGVLMVVWSVGLEAGTRRGRNK
jgi:hypothetical protein